MAGVSIWKPAEVFLFFYFCKALTASQDVFLGFMHEKRLQSSSLSHPNTKPKSETGISAQRLR